MTQDDWDEIAADCETSVGKIWTQEFFDVLDGSVAYILQNENMTMNPEQYLVHKRTVSRSWP